MGRRRLGGRRIVLSIAIASMIVKGFVRTVLLNLMFLPVFIIIVLMIRTQYEGYMDIDANTYGPPGKSVKESLKESVFYGIVIGFIINFIVAAVGIPVDTTGFQYLLMITAVLAFVNIRYAFFPYAGGVLALISMAAGSPHVNVSGLLVLIAAMGLLQSGLIFLNSGKDCIPVFIKHKHGIAGAFLTRRYWPVPLILLCYTAQNIGNDSIYRAMPAWWPAFKPSVWLTGAAIFGLDCVISLLGYSGVSVTKEPKAKGREVAGQFFLYSLLVLGMAVISYKLFAFKVIGAVLAIAGHEAVVIYNHSREKNGTPRFMAEKRGLKVLEVFPGSAAMQMGIQRGDILLQINGRDVQTEEGMLDVLKNFPTFLWISLRDASGYEKTCEHRCYPEGINSLGVLIVPREREVTYNMDTFESFGILKNLVSRFRGFNRPV